jgi:cytochrome c-type biogenesis protein
MDGHDDVVVLAVNIAQGVEDVQPLMESKGYTFPVLMDSGADVATAYMVSGTPTTYFITPEGILLGGVPGYMEEDYLKDLVDQFTVD